jgi:hypothetical protein
VNFLWVWLTLCAIPTAYFGLAYERTKTEIIGSVGIRAIVERGSNSGVMVFIDGRSIKLPFVPMGELPIDEVAFTIKFGETDYGLVAEGKPRVIWFDTPATLAPGSPIKLDTLEQVSKQVFSDPLPGGFDDAIKFVSIVSARITANGRFTPDSVESIALASYAELSSSPSFTLEVKGNTRSSSAVVMPGWVRWVPAVPMVVVWLLGACLITRQMRRRGVVWSIQPDMQYR